MFTLVVFTLVVGAITTGSFVQSANDLRAFGGGFDVRATASPAAPVRDMRAALASAPGLHPADFRVVALESDPSREGTPGRDDGEGRDLRRPRRRRAVPAEHDGSVPGEGQRLRNLRGGLARAAHPARAAVVDLFVAPRKSNYNFAAPPKFHLRGFYAEDKTFAPIPVQVRDPQRP